MTEMALSEDKAIEALLSKGSYMRGWHPGLPIHMSWHDWHGFVTDCMPWHGWSGYRLPCFHVAMQPVVVMIPCWHDAMWPWLHVDITWPWLHVDMVPCGQDSMLTWCYVAVTPCWLNMAMTPCWHDAMWPWLHVDITWPWLHVDMVPCGHDSMLTWCYVAMTPCRLNMAMTPCWHACHHADMLSCWHTNCHGFGRMHSDIWSFKNLSTCQRYTNMGRKLKELPAVMEALNTMSHRFGLVPLTESPLGVHLGLGEPNSILHPG